MTMGVSNRSGLDQARLEDKRIQNSLAQEQKKFFEQRAKEMGLDIKKLSAEELMKLVQEASEKKPANKLNIPA